MDLSARPRRARRGAIAAITSAIVLLAACGAGGEGASASLATTDVGAHLRGPSGVTATVEVTGLVNVAGLAMDGDGRLWASTASMSDDGTDAVYLVGTDGAATPVITGLHTPLGLLWVGDELFVASGTTVVAHTGFDGTQFTAARTVVQLADGVGELNGLAQAPDGRISLGVSAPCNACVPTDPDSAAVLSFLPDGSELRVDASGIRAPVGLAYLPGSDVLLVTMNQRDDLGDATPGDWLAVVSPGQSWGFPDCYGQDESGCADQPTAVAELDAHAAVSGVGIVEGTLGSKVGTAAVVAEWNTGEVLAVPLDPDDPTAASQPHVLITGMTHPMAVLTAADGSVYIGDWASGTVVRLAASAGG